MEEHEENLITPHYKNLEPIISNNKISNGVPNVNYTNTPYKKTSHFKEYVLGLNFQTQVSNILEKITRPT
jgi:hypothetical protein